jgi:hypothetical protein
MAGWNPIFWGLFGTMPTPTLSPAPSWCWKSFTISRPVGRVQFRYSSAATVVQLTGTIPWSRILATAFSRMVATNQTRTLAT